MKPLTVACALESGRYRPDSVIDTSPGLFQVGVNTVRDMHDYGRLDVTGVIRKSSNVGAAKMALSLPAEELWSLLARAGFGQVTASGFPGEASGLLMDWRRWHPIEQATISFGYGISVTSLQLAKAYALFAADGRLRPVSLLRVDEVPRGERLFSPQVARAVRAMMETVVQPGGTATAARVAGYRVAGKTGTVYKSVAGGYAEDRYNAVFAGLAPASRPRLVAVVMISEPRAGGHFGGQVAGPVFSRIMAGALRLLNIAPDDLGPDERAPLLQAALEGPA